MTLPDAIAAYAAPWVSIWLNVLLLGGFVAPVLMLIWRESRSAGIFGIVAGVIGGVSTWWLYSQMGYVKLLGLPHIIVWTPLAILFIARLRSGALRPAPRWIMAASLATILVSLAFDYTDVARYFAGERTPLAPPPHSLTPEA